MAPPHKAALPPLSTRDGSDARASATDAADWRPVRCASDAGHGRGHIYWFPPEVAYLAAEGDHWHNLEALLRPALIARRPAAQRTRKLRSDAVANRAAVRALHRAAGNPPWRPKDVIAAVRQDPDLKKLSDTAIRRIWRILKSEHLINGRKDRPQPDLS